MVEGSVVTNTLDTDMIDSGRALVEAMADRKLELSGALWFYFANSGIWRLIFSSELVESKGPRVMYEKVQSSVHSHSQGRTTLELSDIKVVPPDNGFIMQFKSAIQTSGISGIRFTNNTINGRIIDDAYIYKLTFPQIS